MKGLQSDLPQGKVIAGHAAFKSYDTSLHMCRLFCCDHQLCDHISVKYEFPSLKRLQLPMCVLKRNLKLPKNGLGYEKLLWRDREYLLQEL